MLGFVTCIKSHHMPNTGPATSIALRTECGASPLALRCMPRACFATHNAFGVECKALPLVLPCTAGAFACAKCCSYMHTTRKECRSICQRHASEVHQSQSPHPRSWRNIRCSLTISNEAEFAKMHLRSWVGKILEFRVTHTEGLKLKQKKYKPSETWKNLKHYMIFRNLMQD